MSTLLFAADFADDPEVNNFASVATWSGLHPWHRFPEYAYMTPEMIRDAALMYYGSPRALFLRFTVH